MHIPVTITITCSRDTQNRGREYLLPNKIIHVIKIHTDGSEGSDLISIVVIGVLFDYEDEEYIKQGLENFGVVNLKRGKVEGITKKAILSELVVAGIVIVALFAHSFNEEFYTELFVEHNSIIVRNTILILIGSAVAGFFLEQLIVYRERKLAHQ